MEIDEKNVWKVKQKKHKNEVEKFFCKKRSKNEEEEDEAKTISFFFYCYNDGLYIMITTYTHTLTYIHL